MSREFQEWEGNREETDQSTQTFESKASGELVGAVKEALGAGEVKVGEVYRGLDHGVWGM